MRIVYGGIVSCDVVTHILRTVYMYMGEFLYSGGLFFGVNNSTALSKAILPLQTIRMVLSCAYTEPVYITIAKWFQMVSKSCSVYDITLIVYGNLVARDRLVTPTPPSIT